MKNISEVIRQKERRMAELRAEIAALQAVLPMLTGDAPTGVDLRQAPYTQGEGHGITSRLTDVSS
jgi:hypothetical protein